MNKKRLLYVHLGIVLLAWLYLVQLHWRNDGLWMQGDAPRHATNGIFWKDFLVSGSLNPLHYTLQYYARYPAISPANYPPFFYMLEALVFGVLHPSPYLAKGMVLLFALLAALYLMAWIRRWIGADVGWMACLLLLLPGFVLWSHAVMLNVPSTSLSLAALYHAKRWIEESPGAGASRQLYLAAAFATLAALTYFPAGIVFVVILAWLLVLRRWSLIMNWRTILVCLGSLALLAPWLYVAFHWAPVHTSFVTESFQRITILSGFPYYLKAIPKLAGPLLPVLAGIGLIAGLTGRRWRREILFLATLLLAAYLVLSGLVARDSRYGLLFCAALVCFCAIAFQAFQELLACLIKGRAGLVRYATVAIALVLSGAQAWVAAGTRVPSVQGMNEVVAFMKRVAPAEPVLYDGNHDGVFTFYLRSGDPDFQRRVVLGDKLLYANGLDPRRNYRSFVSSTSDVLRALQTRGGCRWLVIETGPLPQSVPAPRLLRCVVQGPQFEFVRSFTVSGPGISRVDVYKFKLDLDTVDETDLPFPVLGNGVKFKTRPIQR